VYVVADRARVGCAIVTLDMVSVESYVAQLPDRGLRPHDRDGRLGTMKATLSDPDGNRIILFGTISWLRR
jgi:hypothetical protein